MSSDSVQIKPNAKSDAARLRCCFLQARRVIDRDAHPKSAKALDELQRAMDTELNHDRMRRRRMQIVMKDKERSKYRSKLWRLRAQVASLEREAAIHKSAKARGGHRGRVLSQEWTVRVFLAAPLTTGRALSESFRLVAGFDENLVSRTTIGKIRDAWVEMYIRMIGGVARDFVKRHLASCEREKRDFAVVTLLHVQDEADIRLRSGDARDGPALPRRGRASKVQLHVVTMAAGDYWRRELPTEMEALGDKTAATLATCLEALVRRILGEVLPADHQPEIWVFHLLVGDGIPTNEAAAKVVWACMRQRPLAPRVRYFLAVVKCAVHQVALSAKCGVIGVAAETAGGKVYKDIAGVAVRLFKYLLLDYYEEFCTSAREWVLRALRLVEHSEAERTLLGRGPDVNKLRELYTNHVVSDEMLALWNNGLDDLSHMLPRGADPEAERTALVARFTKFVVGLLKPDEHPTLTRFFTFRGCIDEMLTMDLINMPLEVFVLRNVKPREDNQKRLNAVRAFFSEEEAKQVLRRSSMVLQLTGGLEALTAAKPKEGQPPKVVTLATDVATDLITYRLCRLFHAMPDGPLLEIGPATSNLLATAVDLMLRFKKLQQYPFRLCRLCRRWFPETFVKAILDFLHASMENLDVGVSQQLRELAGVGRSESQAIGWLASAPVQDLLEQICREILCHSLDVERRAAQAKHWETSKITHIATASRNTICVRYAMEREAKALALVDAMKKLQHARKMTSTALAWRDGEDRPVGRPYQSGARTDPPGSGRKQSKARANPLGSGHGASPNQVQRVTERDELIQRAQAEVDKLKDSGGGVPITRVAWAMWLEDNLAEFTKLRETAHIRRRAGNTRIRARLDLPPMAHRIQPTSEKAQVHTLWAKNLGGRTGWHGIHTNTAIEKRMIFLGSHERKTFFIDMEPNRVGTDLAYAFNHDFDLMAQLKPLSSLDAALPDDVVHGVFRFEVRSAPCTGGVLIKATRGCRITQPLPRTRRCDEDDEDDIAVPADMEHDDPSSECVVDTDVESEIDSDGSSMESEDPKTKIHKNPKAALDGEDAKGKLLGELKRCHPRTGTNKVHWANEYCYISRASGGGVRATMRNRWAYVGPDGFGTHEQSKHLTPSHFGESAEDPQLTVLLLRAWMLFRSNRDGWATARDGRKRQFEEEMMLLKRDVGKLQPKRGLLGNANADLLLNQWAPSLACPQRA